jgi:hypothetical protein
VVLDILVLICVCVYIYMICCSHEKQKKTKKSGFPECLGTWHSGKAILKKKGQGASPSACAFGTRGRLFKKTKGASPSAWAWALGEEVSN